MGFNMTKKLLWWFYKLFQTVMPESGRDFERGVLVLKIKPILLMNYKAIYEIQQVFKN